MRQINTGLLYLGMIAHECNIFAVSRQLVVISTSFILWLETHIFERVSQTSAQDLQDNTALTYKRGLAQKHRGLSCEDLLEKDNAPSSMQILVICG